VALLSYPGAGNTWFRHLIEQATGFYTGSVYRDGTIFKAGLLGEMDEVLTGRTVVVKSHLSVQQASLVLFKHTRKCIYLFRHPRDAISELNRVLSNTSDSKNSHTDSVNFKKIITKAGGISYLKKKFQGQTNNYQRTYTERVENCPDGILIVFFEGLKKNATMELKKVVEFLGLTNDRLQCLENNLEGKFHRKHNKQDLSWLPQVLSQKDVAYMNSKIIELNNTLYNGKLP